MPWSRAASVGCCLALSLLASGCLSSSNPGSVGTAGMDSGADVSADAGVEVVDPCSLVRCGMTCATSADCPTLTTCVYTEDGCCSTCEPLSCIETSDCPRCTVCDGTTGQCIPIPGDVCVIDKECGGDQICQLDPDGWCGTCVPANPCLGVACKVECTSDDQCGADGECWLYNEGCCSQCVATCDPCPLESAHYCPPIGETHCTGGELVLAEVTPCVFTVTYTGEVGEDVVTLPACSDAILNLPVNGCSLQYAAGDETIGVTCAWCGVTPFSKDTCCIPACDGKDCGPDGCGGSCGECAAGCVCSADGQCLSPPEPVPVWYQCAHAPAMVPAGTAFPVALLARVPGDAQDVAVSTSVVSEAPNVAQVSLVASGNPCVVPGCEKEVVALAWLEAPAPGGYQVEVGSFVFNVGASGGLIGEPACQDDCPPPLEGSGWQITALLQTDGEAALQHCADVETLQEPLSFDGACYDYSVVSDAWDPMPHEALSCTDNSLFFGSAAPYDSDATRCSWMDAAGEQHEAILGVRNGAWSGDGGATVFLIER